MFESIVEFCAGRGLLFFIIFVLGNGIAIAGNLGTIISMFGGATKKSAKTIFGGAGISVMFTILGAVVGWVAFGGLLIAVFGELALKALGVYAAYVCGGPIACCLGLIILVAVLFMLGKGSRLLSSVTRRRRN